MATQYDQQVALADASAKRARSGQVVIKQSDQQWEDTHHGRRACISEPGVLGSSVQTMAMFLSEIPPGGRNGRHRHFNEALIYILEGQGYSIIDDRRYDWEQGDTVSVPLNAWHQHFNPDPTRRVVYLGCTNHPLMRMMGLSHFDDDRESDAAATM